MSTTNENVGIAEYKVSKEKIYLSFAPSLSIPIKVRNKEKQINFKPRGSGGFYITSDMAEIGAINNFIERYRIEGKAPLMTTEPDVIEAQPKTIIVKIEKDKKTKFYEVTYEKMKELIEKELQGITVPAIEEVEELEEVEV